jgi:hypothetical protein
MGNKKKLAWWTAGAVFAGVGAALFGSAGQAEATTESGKGRGGSTSNSAPARSGAGEQRGPAEGRGQGQAEGQAQHQGGLASSNTPFDDIIPLNRDATGTSNTLGNGRDGSAVADTAQNRHTYKPLEATNFVGQNAVPVSDVVADAHAELKAQSQNTRG